MERLIALPKPGDIVVVEFGEGFKSEHVTGYVSRVYGADQIVVSICIGTKLKDFTKKLTELWRK